MLQIKTIDVVVPNGTAILLSTSRNAWQQAQRIRVENNIDETRSFSSESDSIEYQENVVVAIITAFTSVEIFSNEMIPDKKDKTQIEKMPVSEKLAKVLPKMLNTSSPKGREPFWSKFKKLKNVRNRIIHMKSADRTESTPDNPNIWHEIFSIECPHFPQNRFISTVFFPSFRRKPESSAFLSFNAGVTCLAGFPLSRE